MFLELYGGLPTGVGGTAVQGTWFPSDADPTAYNAFNAAAQNPQDWQLEIDVIRTATAQAGLPNQPAGGRWSFLTIAQNNDGVGGAFGQTQAGISFWNTVPGTYKLSVPFSQIGTLGTDATFYQVQFGVNNRFTPPAGGAVPGNGIDYYIDKIRIAPVPVLTPETIFSWETADNAGTPNVNEALEGWSDQGLNAPILVGGDNPQTSLVETLEDKPPGPGDAYAHAHSVSTYKPTHGTKSLTIDTTVSDPAYVNPLGLPQEYRFHWASNFTLNADTDPGPGVTIDPAIKTRITDLATKLNGADSISFDVTFSDPLNEGSIFPTGTLPSFIGIAMHISDGRGSFYQYDAPAIDGATVQALYTEIDPDGSAPDEPVTISFPLSAFTHRGGHGAGDWTGTTPGVNAADLALWKADFGKVKDATANTAFDTDADADSDNDGDVDANDFVDTNSDGADFLAWQRNLGRLFGPFSVDTNSNSLRIGLAINANGPVVAHVDNFRFNTFVQSAPAANVVPEPATAFLLAWAAMLLGVSSRRRGD
jgi:hypothetical protein